MQKTKKFNISYYIADTQFNIYEEIVYLFLRVCYTFFCLCQDYEFGKNANSILIWTKLSTILNCVSAIGSLRFSCADSDCLHTFLFMEFLSYKSIQRFSLLKSNIESVYNIYVTVSTNVEFSFCLENLDEVRKILELIGKNNI